MKKAFRQRLSYANVMATIAVFFALGVGSVYAASKISGKQIKRNSIPANRLTKAARASLRGQRGPRGLQGPPGQTGQTGQTGAAATKLWANVTNSSGTPTLVNGSGATGVASAGDAQTQVTFNQDVRGCSYQATGWLNSTTNGGSTYVNPPIVVVERGPNTSAVPANAVDVQTYTGTTGALGSNTNYAFTVAVFC